MSMQVEWEVLDAPDIQDVKNRVEAPEQVIIDEDGERILTSKAISQKVTEYKEYIRDKSGKDFSISRRGYGIRIVEERISDVQSSVHPFLNNVSKGHTMAQENKVQSAAPQAVAAEAAAAPTAAPAPAPLIGPRMKKFIWAFGIGAALGGAGGAGYAYGKSNGRKEAASGHSGNVKSIRTGT